MLLFLKASLYIYETLLGKIMDLRLLFEKAPNPTTSTFDPIVRDSILLFEKAPSPIKPIPSCNIRLISLLDAKV